MSIKTRPLKGVLPVLQTPINADGSIDEAGLRKLMAWLGGLDIGGYWALGTGSEDMNLTYAKRLQVAHIVTEANAGKLPLILGAGFFAMEDILNFIEETKGLEFDAYHVMPYHPLLSFERLTWFYRHIADRAPKPLWLYYSSNWSKKITPEFVAGLKDHPNIAGIKFSSRDTTDQIKVCGMKSPEFQVITAVATQFFASLALGSSAGTSSLAGCVPEPLIEIYKLFSAGKHAEALEAQKRLTAFLSEMPKGLKNDNFLGAAEEKIILEMRGICQPYTTSYYRDANDAEREQIRASLQKHGFRL
jgi:4-hydroxy-tetrahydrodipicolinate synthase